MLLGQTYSITNSYQYLEVYERLLPKIFRKQESLNFLVSSDLEVMNDGYLVPLPFVLLRRSRDRRPVPQCGGDDDAYGVPQALRRAPVQWDGAVPPISLPKTIKNKA